MEKKAAVAERVVRRLGEALAVRETAHVSGSLLEMEAVISESSNSLGRCATEKALRRLDTDGSPLRIGEIKLTARGRDV